MRLPIFLTVFQGIITFGMVTQGRYHAGFDFGTSGARLSVIDGNFCEVYANSISWNDKYDDPEAWIGALGTLLVEFSERDRIASICCSGTSASCLLVDSVTGKVTRRPRMYNYDVLTECPDDFVAAESLLDRIAPEKHTTRSATSSLIKLLAWGHSQSIDRGERLCHQSDYVSSFLLYGSSPAEPITVTSDWHNTLKLGYDVRALQWPQWLLDCLEEASVSLNVLPSRVVSPGEVIETIAPDVASDLSLSPDTVLVGGTTDSNAAFFAANGPSTVMGTAVTSLGSTLAIKQLSKSYVEDATLGVYSHRFPSVFSDSEAWLVGGASNVGCAILRYEGFMNDELDELSKKIDPATDTPLEYYPLVKPGERFPMADSMKQPLLTPKPADRGEYLHGILQGISDVEREGFRALAQLGANPATPVLIWTCGGGSRNDVWINMRQRRLSEGFGAPVNVKRAENMEASYGAAILAASQTKQ